jgi:hypothetical protein
MKKATISLMAQRETASSPLAEALAKVGDRWTLLVVEALLAGPQRFNDLLDQLPGIAANILSERLKRLEREGLPAALPVRRDARQLVEQVVEPLRPGQQRLHHQQGPPVADPGQRLRER